ncbi:aminoglycoside 3'-phosphotransferase [Klenkia taihuensis]|uniref:Kanamycin kinase n=1 Tax=Klenkia taihuensis TaxID=1225127 RepID=A0A1I1GZV9_9ACTN|nr:aminoglycoside 3'-phosphotransferase [Klenkia taihuensis]GHE09558.1 putative phosphotransferase [Klenkia taihuensis]SFC14703.1 kanamycin kinase [Klenkia taihuensis]
MSDVADLAAFHTLGPDGVPAVVLGLQERYGTAQLVWRNELGGLTFRLGDGPYLKWSPRPAAPALDRERDALGWLAGRHPVPALLDHGADDHAQWLLTAPLPGEHAVGDRWRARRSEAIAAIAVGLRAVHALPVDVVPAHRAGESWAARTPTGLGPRPPLTDPVVVHGDACAPNTLVSGAGAWVGHVDLGDLGVGDRWADLAVASLSLDWNFGEGHQPELFRAYGIEPDPERIRYYRALWELES